MKPAAFSYARPDTVEQAIALLVANLGDAKVIAGGQSLVPTMAFRLVTPALLVDINRIPGLGDIVIDADGVHLGARVRWRDIERDQRLRITHPLLVEAVRHVAHYQIRNRGTVGGSLAHADPAAELPGIATACEAEITVQGPDGTRRISAEAFFRGMLETALAEDELILSLHLPPWPTERCWAFEEIARRRGDFAIAGVALFYDRDPEDRIRNPHIATIGVSDRPLRLSEVESFLAGKRMNPDLAAAAGAIAGGIVDPQDDLHATGAYRQNLIRVLVERGLTRAAREGGAGV